MKGRWRLAGIALGLILARLGTRLYARYSAERRHAAMLAESTELPGEVALDLDTLAACLTQYYRMFSIDHDRWLNSEAARSG